jgi:hypothetical protein
MLRLPCAVVGLKWPRRASVGRRHRLSSALGNSGARGEPLPGVTMHWIIPRRMCRGECRVGSADVRPPSGRAHAQACRWRRAGHRHPQVTEARVALSCGALLLEWWRPRSHVCQSGDRAPCLTSPDRDLPDRTSRSRAPRAVNARKKASICSTSPPGDAIETARGPGGHLAGYRLHTHQEPPVPTSP